MLTKFWSIYPRGLKKLICKQDLQNWQSKCALQCALKCKSEHPFSYLDNPIYLDNHSPLILLKLHDYCPMLLHPVTCLLTNATKAYFCSAFVTNSFLYCCIGDNRRQFVAYVSSRLKDCIGTSHAILCLEYRGMIDKVYKIAVN